MKKIAVILLCLCTLGVKAQDSVKGKAAYINTFGAVAPMPSGSSYGQVYSILSNGQVGWKTISGGGGSFNSYQPTGQIMFGHRSSKAVSDTNFTYSDTIGNYGFAVLFGDTSGAFFAVAGGAVDAVALGNNNNNLTITQTGLTYNQNGSPVITANSDGFNVLYSIDGGLSQYSMGFSRHNQSMHFSDSLGNGLTFYGNNGGINYVLTSQNGIFYFLGNNLNYFGWDYSGVSSPYNVKVPATQGTGALTNDGSGNLSWGGAWSTTGNAGTTYDPQLMTDWIGTTDLPNYGFGFGFDAHHPCGNMDLSGSVYLGSNAGYGDNTVHDNGSVGIGGGALYSNPSDDGAYNVAIGAAAMYNNINGFYNASTGVQALYTNINGAQNSAHGAFALYLTTGSYNTGLGYAAGGTNADGSQNTLIGANADVASGSLNNATAIGYGAIATGSNQIMLGNTSVTDFQIGGAGVITGTPTNTVTPTAWMQVTIGGTVYWFPLYQ